MSSLALFPVAFGVPGWPEVAVIALLVLLFFGGKKIPELTRSLIQSAKEIRTAVRQEDAGSEVAEEESKTVRDAKKA